MRRLRLSARLTLIIGLKMCVNRSLLGFIDFVIIPFTSETLSLSLVDEARLRLQNLARNGRAGALSVAAVKEPG